MNCGICGESANKRLYCGSCASHLVLRPRISLVKALAQSASWAAQVDAVLGSENGDSVADIKTAAQADPRTGLLDSHVSELRAKLRRTQQAVLGTQHDLDKLRQQIAAARQTLDIRRADTDAKFQTIQNNFASDSKSEQERISELERAYRQSLHQSLSLQTRCCQDLISIFVLKKKRRRHEYDIVLGFDTVPAFGQLGRYSVPVINSGLERVGFFSALLASYLGIQLPFELRLPRKSSPYCYIGPDRLPMRVGHSVKTMLHTMPGEFYGFCRTLAMMALNVAYLAGKLGIPNIDTSTVPRVNMLVAQIYLCLENLVKNGHQIQIYAMSLDTDIETLQDSIITSIDVDLNGGAAEWNIVENPASQT